MDVELQIAWAAGFFDGDEGCVMIQRRKGRTGARGGAYVMGISVSQKIPDPLYLVMELLGCGSVHQTKHRWKYGCEMWFWRASGNFACGALKRLLPYLVVKRSQAEIAIAFQERRIHVHKDKFNREIVARQVAADEIDRLRLKVLKHGPEPPVSMTQQ
jgi:hypothetical protein